MFANKSRNLDKIIQTIESIYTNIFDYMDKLSIINFEGSRPEDYDNILRAKENLDTDTYRKYLNIPKVDMDSDLSVIYKLDWYITYHAAMISYILNIFDEFSLKTSHTNRIMNNGAIITTGLIKRLNDELNSIQDKFQGIDLAECRDILLLTVKTTGLTMEEIIALNSKYEEYVTDGRGKYVVDLYIQHISMIMDGLSRSNEIYRYLSDYIEHLKSMILEPMPENKNNRINFIQDTMQRFGLIPITQFQSLQQTLSDYIIVKKITKNIFDDLAKATGHTVILIVKTVGTHIEYNNWTLTNREYLDAKGLYQFPDVGVNKKMVERFMTIRSLPEYPGLELKDGLYIYGSGDNCLILETFDGNNYRFLSLYIGVAVVPMSRVAHIIDGKYPSSRLIGYNQIINNEIVKYIEEPLDNIPKINISNIKYQILDQFDEHIRGLRNKTNPKEIAKVFHKRGLIDKLVDIVENILSYNELEVIISITSELDKFRRQMNNDFYASLQADSEDRVVLKDILTEILEKNISKNKNIFTTIMTKRAVVDRFMKQ